LFDTSPTEDFTILLTENIPGAIMQITDHAELRLHQRGIQEDELSLLMAYGTQVYNGGALFIFMRKCDIPGDIPSIRQKKLEGLTAVLDAHSFDLISVYKNRKALRQIKRKYKSDNAPRSMAA
jgi:hypothetical protein